MHQLHWKFKQDTPLSTWEIDNVPVNAEGAVITHIITTDGQVLQPENQIQAPYGLQLSFGVQEFAGTAYGTYYTDDDDVITTPDGKTIIQVTQTNNNNTPR